MRGLLIATLFIVVAMGSKTSAAGGAEAAAPKLVRDQPRLRHVFSWNGQVVAELVDKTPLRRIDLAQGSSAALTIDGADSVLSVATQGKNPLALIRKNGEVRLWSKAGSEPLPEPLRSSTNSLTLVASDDVLAVLDGGVPTLSKLKVWKTLHSRKAARGWFSDAAIAGRTLYLAYDQGEWGGALLALDLESDSWSEPIPQSGEALPVKKLRQKDGALYVLEGLAHLGLRDGRLRTLRDGKWSTIVEITDFPKKARTNWSLEPTSFEGLDLDAQGRPLVLTWTQGIVRLDPQPTRLTPSWRYDTYLAALHVVGDVAVIGTYDAGVILWPLAGGAARIVRFK